MYGVVPISLCRSGGCGLTTSSSGVRIDIDEDSESIEPSAVITHGQSIRSNGMLIHSYCIVFINLMTGSI